MSIHSFLYSKQKQETIQIYLKEIIAIYEDLLQNMNYENNAVDTNYNELKQIESSLFIFNYQLLQSQQNCKFLQEKMNQMCEHCYVTDLIDITPDHSKSIEYCENCLHHK